MRFLALFLIPLPHDAFHLLTYKSMRIGSLDVMTVAIAKILADASMLCGLKKIFHTLSVRVPNSINTFYNTGNIFSDLSHILSAMLP